MNDPAPSQRPSNEIKVLRDQLLRALECLKDKPVEPVDGKADGPTVSESEDKPEDPGYLQYLRYALALALRRVASGDLEGPKEVLDQLIAAQPFIDAHLPRAISPEATAALELDRAIAHLRLADEALASKRTEVRLSKRGRSATEREVLRVLWNNREHYLVRRDIHRKLPPPHRPTPGRVGQILVDLYHDNLLLRVQRQAQGSPRASFYSLSPQGRKLCQNLGLDRNLGLDNLVPVFDPPTEKMGEDHLTPEHLVPAAEEPHAELGRIVALHSYLGGVGRTTAVAHSAYLLAADLGGGGNLLVADLDLDAPGLDLYLAPRGLGRCRGFRGLVTDFYRCAESRRSEWLQEAIRDPEYTIRPAKDQMPNLFYLPSGFTPYFGKPPGAEHSEALNWLRQEVFLHNDQAQTNKEHKERGFLNELRGILQNVFDKTLLDSQAGMSISAWQATQILADDLILFHRFSEKGLQGLQVILTKFIYHATARRHINHPRIAFAFAPTAQAIEENLEEWIKRNILKSKNIETCRSAAIPYDPQLASGSRTFTELEKYRALTNLLSLNMGHLREMIEEDVLKILECNRPDVTTHRIVEGLIMSCPNADIVKGLVDKLEQSTRPKVRGSIQALIHRVKASQRIRGIQRLNVFS